MTSIEAEYIVERTHITTLTILLPFIVLVVEPSVLEYLVYVYTPLVFVIASISSFIKRIDIAKTLKVSVKVVKDVLLEHEEAIAVYSIASPLFEYYRIRRFIPLLDIGLKIVGIHIERHGLEYIVKVILRGRPGRHTLSFVRIVAYDLLLLTKVDIRIRHRPVELRYIPRSHVEKLSTILAKHYDLVRGFVSTRFSGYGTEFLSIREYVPGDEFRRIDWKSSARLGKLMVKEFSHEIHRGVVFVLAINDRLFASEALDKLISRVIEAATRYVYLGLWVRIGIVTERGIYLSPRIELRNRFEVYRTLSSIDWPYRISSVVSVNRVIPWFTRRIVEESCREKCVVELYADIVDELDAVMFEKLRHYLSSLGHELRIHSLQPHP